MKNSDRIVGAVVLTLAGYVGWESYAMPTQPASAGFGPGAYPLFLAGLLAVLGLVLITGTFLRKAPEATGSAVTESPQSEQDVAAPITMDSEASVGEGLDFSRHGVKVPLVFACLILIYFLISEHLGFLISAVVLLFALLKVLGNSWRLTAITAVVATTVLYLVFDALLGVNLPSGLLGGLGL